MKIAKKQKGFTLMEMIVSLTIFIMITTIVIANFKLNNTSRQVRFDAQDFQSVLRKAQLMSLFGRTISNNVVPIGGYGIHIEQCLTPICSYFMFADLDGELDYDSGEELPGERHFFSPNTIVDSLNETPMDIVFKPPRPFVCMNGKCEGYTDIVISIKQKNTNIQNKVIINPISGRISIE